MQGFLLHNFIHYYLKRDMKFRDYLCSHNIEYNNPYARDGIRQFNKNLDHNGYFWTWNFKIDRFCFQMLELHFPMINGVWCNNHHFTMVSVLELTCVCLEYGFFDEKDVIKLAVAIQRACHSLNKLEDAWNEKMEKEEEEFKEELRDEFLKSGWYDGRSNIDPSEKNRGGLNQEIGVSVGLACLIGVSEKQEKVSDSLKNTSHMNLSLRTTNKAKLRLMRENQKEGEKIEWATSEKRIKLVNRLNEVANNLAKCKEHIGCIIIQILSLHYDTRFVTVYPTYVYKKFSFVSPEIEEKRMMQEIEDNFPFYQTKLNESILQVTLTYLSEVHYLDQVKVDSEMAKKAVEKCFMYVCTAERDCF